MNVAVFSLPSYDAVQKVFGEAKTYLGEILSAFEFFDKQSVSRPMRYLLMKLIIRNSTLLSRSTKRKTARPVASLSKKVISTV